MEERDRDGETILVTTKRQDGETGEFFMERYYTGDDPASSFFVRDIQFGEVFLSHEE